MGNRSNAFDYMVLNLLEIENRTIQYFVGMAQRSGKSPCEQVRDILDLTIESIIEQRTTSSATNTQARSHEDAEPRTTAEKTIAETVHGRISSQGALDSSCSLFDAIHAYMGPEQQKHANIAFRHLLRLRRTFISPDPRLSDVTPNVLAAYLGGPGGTESQSQVHAKVLNDFLAWCMERQLIDPAEWSGAPFHEHHPVLGKERWYKRSGSRRPQ